MLIASLSKVLNIKGKKYRYYTKQRTMIMSTYKGAYNVYVNNHIFTC